MTDKDKAALNFLLLFWVLILTGAALAKLLDGNNF